MASDFFKYLHKPIRITLSSYYKRRQFRSVSFIPIIKSSEIAKLIQKKKHLVEAFFTYVFIDLKLSRIFTALGVKPHSAYNEELSTLVEESLLIFFPSWK
jgi:hypothetical protein